MQALGIYAVYCSVCGTTSQYNSTEPVGMAYRHSHSKEKRERELRRFLHIISILSLLKVATIKILFPSRYLGTISSFRAIFLLLNSCPFLLFVLDSLLLCTRTVLLSLPTHLRSPLCLKASSRLPAWAEPIYVVSNIRKGEILSALLLLLLPK